MEDWIAGTFAVLGTLMVLAGATLIVLRTIGRLNALPDADTQPLGGALAAPAPGQGAPPADPAGAAAPRGRWGLRRLSPPTQLIAWGIVLLLAAAFTVGLMSFGVSLEAGTGDATPAP